MQIAPSLLSCDFSQLEREIKAVENGGCDLLHLDVMDGHFVPNITFGPVVIKGIRKLTKLPLDAHLMVDTPENWIDKFVEVGVDWISVHIEATKKLEQVIELIKKAGKQVGIALNPKTPVEAVFPWLERIDFVVVMTVEPGFGGQEFLEEPLSKVKTLRDKGVDVQVDGGVKMDTLPSVIRAGANIIVSGSGIFKTENPAVTIKKFKGAIKDVTSL
jgi:ribulose-phosphate 3-epimerase